MPDQDAQKPILTFNGKQYEISALPEETVKLMRGMQVADAQMRFHEDTLRLLAAGRQSIAMQLNEQLKHATPMAET